MQMVIAAFIISIVSVVATIAVAWLVDSSTNKLFRRMAYLLPAEMSPEKHKAILRLVDDMERTGEKRGTLNQRDDGSWGIDYALEISTTLGMVPQSEHKKQKRKSK
jgi:hypothetical protein